jgi:hypothetical protein
MHYAGKRARRCTPDADTINMDDVEKLLPLSPSPQPLSKNIHRPVADSDSAQQLHIKPPDVYRALLMPGKPEEQPIRCKAEALEQGVGAGSSHSTPAICLGDAALDGQYMSVTTDTGERVYCSMAAPSFDKITVHPHCEHRGHFLRQPLGELMQDVCSLLVARPGKRVVKACEMDVVTWHA